MKERKETAYETISSLTPSEGTPSEKRIIDANQLYLHKFVEPRTEWHQGWNDALDAVALQEPTVDVAPVVHAHWMPVEVEDYWDPPFTKKTTEIMYECSACRTQQWGRLAVKPGLHYCPDCGAKMDAPTDCE